ncbi:MAG: hypothetical protein M3142_10700 [Bacteroidota bacterium]|nr:hypothetical protein [Bacteroidota bacterium]
MNKSALLHMMNHVSALSDHDVEELEKLVKNFPYCQTAHLLIAKASYDKGNMLSNQKLRKAAAYATNRHLLKKLIYTSDATVALSVINEEQFTETATEEPVTNSSTPVLAPEVAEQPIITEATNQVDSEGAEFIQDSTTTTELPAISQEDYEVVAEDVSSNQTEAETEESNFEKIVEEPESSLTVQILETTPEYDSLVVEEAQPSVAHPKAVPTLELSDAFTPAEVDELLQVENWKPNSASTIKVEENELDLVDSEQSTEIAKAKTEPAPIIRYELEVPEEMEDSPLDQTLANFDSYLFKPEHDEYFPGELKAATNEEFIREVYISNQVGYWMGSSRLGEVLQVKDELTRHTPLQFYPDLILEYSKQNYLTPTDPPKASPVSRQFEIIDQFLKANPKLKTFSNEKLRSEPQDDLAFKSTKNTKNLASENLANILIQQGKLKKAIKIYEHLIVKIPEKKAYFASQIENLRNQL